MGLPVDAECMCIEASMIDDAETTLHDRCAASAAAVGTLYWHKLDLHAYLTEYGFNEHDVKSFVRGIPRLIEKLGYKMARDKIVDIVDIRLLGE